MRLCGSYSPELQSCSPSEFRPHRLLRRLYAIFISTVRGGTAHLPLPGSSHRPPGDPNLTGIDFPNPVPRIQPVLPSPSPFESAAIESACGACQPTERRNTRKGGAAVTETVQFFLALGVAIGFAKAMGYLTHKLNQPSVLGELI